MGTDSKTTSLHSAHLALGAKMLDFGGFDMPIEYEGVVAEHTAVREACGIFDVSHMGKIRIAGESAADSLSSILVSTPSKLTAGSAQYSMLLNETGGVIDDLLVYRISENEFWIVPNASNADEMFSNLRSLLPTSLAIENLHNSHGILAVQGPKSNEVLHKIGVETGIDYMQVRDLVIAGVTFSDSLLCRSGYTGEHGYEIITPNQHLAELWQQLTTAGAKPAGLGARDTLRTEMGYPLHGQDISPTISPVSAGLRWAIDLDSEFVGKAALLAEIDNQKLFRVAIKLTDRGVPRSHMQIFKDDKVVGETTSGTFSPTLKVGIALGLVQQKLAIGEKVEIDVRGRKLLAEVVGIPFVESRVK